LPGTVHSEHSIAIHFGLIDNAAEIYTLLSLTLPSLAMPMELRKQALSPRTSVRFSSTRELSAVNGLSEA
jgi:hypothetical protein